MTDELFIFGAAASALKLLLYWAGSGQTRPRRAELVGHVSGVNLYPVKSMRGLVLETALCTHTGLRHPAADLKDRSWMVTYGETDRFVTARQEPRLLLIQPTLRQDNLDLDLDSMPTLKLPLHPIASDSKVKVIRLWGEDIECVDCGEEAAAWISRALGDKAGHRLVYHNHSHPIRAAGSQKRLPFIRDRPTKSSDKLTFTDDGPYLLTTDSSLRDLNGRMEQPLHMETFRPNISVSGVSKPFDEDSWKELFIGDVKFSTMMFCSRCMLTTIDGSNGSKRSSNEPLSTLRSYRKVDSKADGPCFGIYLVCDRIGTININDPVYVIRGE